MSSPRVWFITGSSTGFGRRLAELVLQNGEIVVATARKSSALHDLVAQYSSVTESGRLLVLQLDVSQPQEIVAAFAQAKAAFGRIDVVVNNAAYAVMGEVESVREGDARVMFETNFWGAYNVTREAVSFFREVNAPGVGGRLLQMSSITGLTGGAGLAFYSASKFALEGLTESLAAEIDPAWNIKANTSLLQVTLIEPASFHTEGQAKVTWAPAHPAYTNLALPAMEMRNGWGTYAPPGDVNKAVEVIFNFASEPDPPLHLPLGERAIGFARKKIATLSGEIDKYESWSEGLTKNN
ncbi:NAD-P-binding protein [Daedaleopsis nitida]|nr:NAD-P-binding protein [Daedaleopsis nitida]